MSVMLLVSPIARWLRLPAVLLIALLQRTPALRVVADAGSALLAPVAGQVLKSSLALAAALGSMHTLAGATTYIQVPENPVRGTVGQPLSVTFTYTGTPTQPASFRVSGTLPPGLTIAGLSNGIVNSGTPVISGTPAQAGSYTVQVQGYNTPGAIGNTNGILQPIMFSIAVGSATAPAIATQPIGQSVPAGGTATLTLSAAGTEPFSYQWRKDGVALSGATQATLTLPHVSTADMGFYSAVVSNSVGTVESTPAALLVTGGSSRLINVSTRGYVPAGGDLTPGFVLKGTGTKSLVIRGVGPTLSDFGLSGVLADPKMEVIPLGGAVPTLTNDNWGAASNLTALTAAITAVQAFPLKSGSADAAALAALTATPQQNAYTVRIAAAGAPVAGLALAEVYDTEALTSAVRLVNVSTRGFAGTGVNALTPGFVIGGDGPKTLLIRAVGPGLAQFGVGDLLADPQLTVIPLGKNFVVGSSDNWGGTPALQAAFAQTYAFGLASDSKDAAVVVQLPPGGYTVVVSGVGDTTGTVLVEVYDMDP